MRFLPRIITAALLTLQAVFAASNKYGPGVTDTEIKIGNITPYSGPASAYGTMGQVQAAYFKMINDQGGVRGRKITFVTVDGAYNPAKTVEVARRLVERDGVLLLCGVLGTAPNVAIQKYLNARKVPHLFVLSGASQWNNPRQNPWTLGFIPDYQFEASVYASYILKTKPSARIGILYQNDDYGKDYVTGFKKALGARAAGMIVAEVSYEVSDPTIDSQIVKLKGSGADVFFNVSTPKFATQAIRRAHDIGWTPQHYLNLVASSAGAVLQPAGFDKANGIISSAYAKDPNDAEFRHDPDVEAWHAFMRKYYPAGSLEDQFNVNGYVLAATMARILEQCGNDLTRENIMRQAASLSHFSAPLLLPGVTMTTSATDFAPIESVRLMRFDGKRWVRFGDVIERGNF
jgi:branched-chain amino acid transport system substrate-binding protein